MKLSKMTGTAALVFLAVTLPAYAQKDEKENGKEQPQHAQPAAPQPKPQQAKPAEQPHPAQQAKQAPQSRPEQQSQQHEAQPQQAKAPAPEQPKPSPVHNSEQRPAAQQAGRTPQAEHSPARAQAERAPTATHIQTPQVQRSSSQVQSWQQQRGWVKQGGGWQPHTSFQQGRDQNWGSDHRNWSQRGGYGGAYISQVSFGMYFGSAHFFHIGPMPLMYMGYPRFPYGGYSFLLLDPWPESWQENWYASDDVYIDYSDGYYLYDRRYPGVRLAVTVVM